MMPVRPIALLACALSLTAWGQQPDFNAPPMSPSLEEEWTPPPSRQSEVTPPPPPPAVPDEEPSADATEPSARGLTPPPSSSVPDEELEEAPPPPPLAPNEVSLYAANALGKGHGAVALSIGYPYLSARAAYGVLPTLDAGISFQTLYGQVSDLRALVRWQVLAANGWHMGLLADGGYAFFLLPAETERTGARWLTGLRNWNLSPGVAISFQDHDPRATRFFMEARYELAFDTEPFQRNPLGGIPTGVQVFQNFPVRFGAEFPWSPVTSVLVTFGLDIHGNPDDSAVVPMLALGLVTSLL